jgi:Flp pilus assembly protein TadG
MSNGLGRISARTSILARAAGAFLGRFGASTRGNVAMLFAVAMPVLVMITMGSVDISRAQTVRAALQDALDVAALAAARSSATTNEEINEIGNRALRANLQHFSEATLSQASFTLNDNHVVVASAKVNVKTLVAGIVLPDSGRLFNDYIPVGSKTEVNRSAKNLEVAMVLDVTGSMAGTKLSDLQTAAKGMIDTVVKDQQSPYTSRVALIPYSMGVNLGSNAVNARGSVPSGRTITANSRSCTYWSCGNNVLTANGHGFKVGDRIFITGARGATGLNTRTGWASGVGGSSPVAWQVTAVTTNTFTINGSVSGTYSGGGVVYCASAGCEYQAFNNYAGGVTTNQISTCVTERIGAQAYTDASPSAARVGLSYPVGAVSAAGDNRCLASQVKPLSSDRSMLKGQIDSFVAVGSTAGQIGLAWGWYTLSPNFNSLWSGASAAGAYSTTDTVKVVVLMTDGEFNSPHAQGVLAGQGAAGTGYYEDQINIAPTNGSSLSQAQQLCNAIKGRGIAIYTVAFDVPAESNAAVLLNNCASSTDKAFVASSGTQLIAAFQAIGRDITQLRISK